MLRKSTTKRALLAQADTAIENNDLTLLKRIIAEIDEVPRACRASRSILISAVENRSSKEIVSYLLTSYGNDYLDSEIEQMYEMSCFHQDLYTFMLLKSALPFPPIHTQVTCATWALRELEAGFYFAKTVLPMMPNVFTNIPSFQTDPLLSFLIEDSPIIVESRGFKKLMRQHKVVLELYPGEIIDTTVRSFIHDHIRDIDVSYATLSKVLGRSLAHSSITKTLSFSSSLKKPSP